MNYRQRNWVKINLDNLKHNFLQIRGIVPKDTKILAVVKADGYGCGSVRVANTLIDAGADFLAVAFTDEGVVLRNAGIDKRILILGNTDESLVEDLFKYNITPAVYDVEFASKLSEYAEQTGETIKIHIKIDTGMGRIGFLSGFGSDEKTIEEILKISKMPGIEIEGIFTHFALADEEDTTYTEKQFARFLEINRILKEKGLDIEIKHCANSAATMMYPKTHLDMVRPGIILYGCYPSDYLERKKIDLKPVMQFETRITNIKEINKGDCVSYGCTFVAEKKTKIATIPVGYADGLSRNLSNRYSFLVNGQFVPVVGRICMDQCMIDVTNVNNIHKGDEVVIFGEQKGVKNSIEKMATALGTINYEILCDVGKRVPRVYIKDNKVMKIDSLIL